MLYQKLNVSILPQIQNEVLDFFELHPELLQSDATHEYFVQMDFDKFPILKNFIVPRVLTEIVETSTCFLPGNTNLKLHIDGLRTNNENVPTNRLRANQWVMVIPIANTENTINYWYKNEDVRDEDERIVNRVRPEPPYNFYISFVKDDVKIDPIGSTTLTDITLIKSDIYHNVENKSDKTRLVFIIRFREDGIYETPAHVFNYKDLI